MRGSALATDNSGVIADYDNAPAMNCSTNSLCTNLNNYISDDQWLLLKGYIDGEQVMLQEVICHDDVLADFNTCVKDEDDVTWSF